jgi:hypothetical protein
MPPVKFVSELMDAFSMYLHHLTPNGILVMAKFY